MQRYGLQPTDDILAKRLALNLELAAPEHHGEAAIAPWHPTKGAL